MLGFSPLASAPLADDGVSIVSVSMVADSGSFAVTGQPVVLQGQLEADFLSGSFSITGQAVNFFLGQSFEVSSGSFSQTGQSITISIHRKISVLKGSVSLTGQAADLLRQVVLNTQIETIIVTQSGGQYILDGVIKPVITLERGRTYIFDQSDGSMSNHPIAFRDGSNNSYTTGVTTVGTAGQAGSKVTFVVPSNAPDNLKYYCAIHGNSYGNSINVVDAKFLTTGNTVVFPKAVLRALVAGSFSIVGQAVDFTKALRDAALSASYAITLQPVNLTRQITESVGSGGLTLSGIAVNLSLNRNMSTESEDFDVAVVYSGGNVYQINGVTKPALTLKRGIIYRFNQSDSTNNNHPLNFKDGSGNIYTAGVVFKLDGTTVSYSQYTNAATFNAASVRIVEFTVPANAPDTLRYYCVYHGNGMGNTINVIDLGFSLNFENIEFIKSISIDPIVGSFGLSLQDVFFNIKSSVNVGLFGLTGNTINLIHTITVNPISVVSGGAFTEPSYRFGPIKNVTLNFDKTAYENKNFYAVKGWFRFPNGYSSFLNNRVLFLMDGRTLNQAGRNTLAQIRFGYQGSNPNKLILKVQHEVGNSNPSISVNDPNRSSEKSYTSSTDIVADQWYYLIAYSYLNKPAGTNYDEWGFRLDVYPAGNTTPIIANASDYFSQASGFLNSSFNTTYHRTSFREIEFGFTSAEVDLFDWAVYGIDSQWTSNDSGTTFNSQGGTWPSSFIDPAVNIDRLSTSQGAPTNSVKTLHFLNDQIERYSFSGRNTPSDNTKLLRSTIQPFRRGLAASGSVANTLIAGTGAYSLSGSVEIRVDRKESIASGSFIQTPQDAVFNISENFTNAVFLSSGQSINISKSISIDAETGNFVEIGQPSNLIKSIQQDVSSGSFIITGQDIIISPSVLLSEGAFILSGLETNLLKSLKLNAQTESFVLTGYETPLLRQINFSIDSGSFSQSGYPIGIGIPEPIDAGIFNLTFQDASILSVRSIDVQSASFALTGSTDLQFITGPRMPADAGSFLINGRDVQLKKSLKLSANNGQFSVVGENVALPTSLSQDINFVIENGVFIVSGQPIQIFDRFRFDDSGGGNNKVSVFRSDNKVVLFESTSKAA